MRKRRFKGNVRHKFFLVQRVVAAWNVLTRRRVEADVIVMLRRLFNRHMNIPVLEGFMCWQMGSVVFGIIVSTIIMS